MDLYTLKRQGAAYANIWAHNDNYWIYSFLTTTALVHDKNINREQMGSLGVKQAWQYKNKRVVIMVVDIGKRLSKFRYQGKEYISLIITL